MSAKIRFEKARKSLFESLNILENKILENSANKELENIIIKMELRVEDFKKELSTKDENIHDLNGKIENLQSEILANKQEIDSFSQKNRNLLNDLTNAKLKQKELVREIEEHIKEIEEIIGNEA